MSAQFTPGPWSVFEDEEGYAVATASDGEPVARPYPVDHVPLAQANARLIAAAPELYGIGSRVSISGPDADGLMWLHVEAGGLHGMFNLGQRSDTIAMRALHAFERDRAAALAKARGETP